MNYKTIFQHLYRGQEKDGDACKVLEREIEQKFGADHALCFSQARSGIYFAVKALIKPGQKVILSPYTIADVINMVICAGGVPVFADIQRETCNIDHRNLEKLIDHNTGAVMITHLHGLACDIEPIQYLCRKKKIYLIEDAAQAFGTRYKNRPVGTFGDAGIFSFGMYKNITSFFGGMVITPHDDIYNKILKEQDTLKFFEPSRLIKKVISGMITDIATSPVFVPLLIEQVFRFGHLHNIRIINKYVETELDLTGKEQIPENYLRKMLPLQARLILNQLDQVEDDSRKRIHYGVIYHRELSEIPELILPPLRTDLSHIYNYFPVQYSDRKRLLKWLVKHHRDVGKQHLKNCADLPSFQKYRRECEIARKTADEVILLPTYPRYSEGEVLQNVEVIREFFGS